MSISDAERKAIVDEVVRFVATALSMHYEHYGSIVRRTQTTAGSQMVRVDLPQLTVNLVITPAKGS